MYLIDEYEVVRNLCSRVSYWQTQLSTICVSKQLKWYLFKYEIHSSYEKKVHTLSYPNRCLYNWNSFLCLPKKKNKGVTVNATKKKWIFLPLFSRLFLFLWSYSQTSMKLFSFLVKFLQCSLFMFNPFHWWTSMVIFRVIHLYFYK